MEILVNSEKIDFELENEQSLGDVVSGIESWLNSSRLVITSLRMGDRDLAAEPEGTWSSIPLADVPGLDITARLFNEVQRSQLELMHSYLRRLADGVDGADARALEELLDVFPDTAATMRETLDLAAGSTAGREVQELSKLIAGSTGPMVASWPQGIIDKAGRIIARLVEIIDRRIAELRDPAESLRQAALEIAGSALELEEVSVLLQTGQDERAMGYVIRFSDLLAAVMRTVSILGDTEAVSLDALEVAERPLKDYLADLNGVLTEIAAAFESRDAVLLGDLLEYEVSPRLETLVPFLREFRITGK